MAEFLGAAAIAFGAIFLAEFGDKSQLLVLAFATRYPWRPVVAGVVIAAAIIQGASVHRRRRGRRGPPRDGRRGRVRARVPCGRGLDAPRRRRRRRGGPSEPAATGGDGARADRCRDLHRRRARRQDDAGDLRPRRQPGPIPTWIGSTLGEVAANLVAVAVGRQLGHRLSPRFVRIGSAVVFALAGVAVLVGAFVA